MPFARWPRRSSIGHCRTEQVGSIVAFLRTLTGTYRGAPVTAAPVTAVVPAAATDLSLSPNSRLSPLLGHPHIPNPTSP